MLGVRELGDVGANVRGRDELATARQWDCSSNRRFQPRSATDRLAESFHGEFDIVRLEVAPALTFRLVAVLREALKVFRGDLFGRDA